MAERVAVAHPEDTEVLAGELLAQAAGPDRSDDIALLLARFTGVAASGSPAKTPLTISPHAD
jgi:hypothetical protein